MVWSFELVGCACMMSTHGSDRKKLEVGENRWDNKCMRCWWYWWWLLWLLWQCWNWHDYDYFDNDDTMVSNDDYYYDYVADDTNTDITMRMMTKISITFVMMILMMLMGTSMMTLIAIMMMTVLWHWYFDYDRSWVTLSVHISDNTTMILLLHSTLRLIRFLL